MDAVTTIVTLYLIPLTSCADLILDQKVIHHRTTDDIVSKPFEINVPFGQVQTYKTQPMSTKIKVPLKLAGLFNTANAYHAHKLDHFY